MAVNTVVDHLDEPFFEKQLLLDWHFCKPYSVAHVKKHGWTVAYLTICVGRDCGNGCGCGSGHGSEHYC